MPDTERMHKTWIHSGRFVPKTFVRPIQAFIQIESSAGGLMLAAALLAIWLANSSHYPAYQDFLNTPISVGFGDWSLQLTLMQFINDGLMAVFFFVVGLEVKHSLILGDLRDPKAAALPLIGALGGMIFPAFVYLMIVRGFEPASAGWGIPIATDIAFSIGVLSMLGRRVSSGAKIFLLTLAVADDLGGILVIAFFYTTSLSGVWLSLGLGGLLAVHVASRAGIRSHIYYIPMAVVVWYCFLMSGVHATIAGVALAFLTPALPMYGVKELDVKARMILDTYPAEDETPLLREQSDYEAFELAEIARESTAPLVRYKRRLTVWSSFIVIPVFALANAGVNFGETGIKTSSFQKLALATGVGLVLGKTVGISLFSWLAVKLGIARLPESTTWRQMIGVAATAGIGFTVALFITALAFSDPGMSAAAKIGIFAGSIVSGLIGVTILLSERKPVVSN